VPEKVTYRFLVLREPMVNAFALPNGSTISPQAFSLCWKTRRSWQGFWVTRRRTSTRGTPILKTEASARRPSLQRLLRLPPFWSPADMAPGWPRLPRAT